MPRQPKDAAVAASGEWTDPDGFRFPAGSVHAWLQGTNQTLCGLQLSRAKLLRFPHIQWVDVQPDAGRVTDVCPGCAAGMGARRDDKPSRREDPRP